MNTEVAFLRGYPKSGTNWFCNILNLHPNIVCHGEFHFEHLHQAFRVTIDRRFGLLKQQPQKFRNEYFKFVKNLVKSYCLNLNDKENIKVVVDRTPQLIESTFIPGSKYLYISRDGRDVLVSWTYHCLRLKITHHPYIKSFVQTFEQNPDYFEDKKNTLLDNKIWVKNVARGWNNQIVKDFAHMKKADEGKINYKYYCVKYEDLHSNTNKIRNEVYSFLGVDASLAKELTDFTKPGFSNRKTINTSFYRSGKAGKWRSYFTEEQHKWFIEETKSAFEILGLNNKY